MKTKTTEIIKKTGKSIEANPLKYLKVFGFFIAGYAIYKSINGLKHAMEPTDVSYQLPPLPVNNNDTTITDQQAQIYAQQLLNAMDKWGTDADTIYEIFKKITPEDFKKIYNAFGKYYYDGSGQPWVVFGNEAKKDLVYWLNAELGYINYPTYKLVKNIVEQAGFVFD